MAAVIDADRDVPALLVKVGRYPVHGGGVGVARSLGRLGVPVHVLTEDRFTPLAVSRYRSRRFGWRTTGLEDAEDLVAGLSGIGREVGRRSVAIPTDDEAAVLLAEHADALSEYFMLPRIEPGLTRQLASKHQLYRLCREHDVPAPETTVVTSRDELIAFAATATFPVVAKNAEPWTRLSAPIVGSTQTLRTAADLLALARGRTDGFSLLLQEHIPPQESEHWFSHMYCDARSDCLTLMTGIKLRSWPPRAGVTACGYGVSNPALAELTRRFCKAVGYRGVAGLDWCLDQRDGQYKLVDFNPRVASQFPVLRTREGIDVVRALHLDLTGRGVPAGEQDEGRRIVVEQYDLAARVVYGRSRRPASVPHPSSTVLAFAARDDPLPFLAMWPRQIGLSASHLSRRSRGPATPPRHPGKFSGSGRHRGTAPEPWYEPGRPAPR